ncbi:hypothetical protein RFI_39306 [Reticulomyxa filosa]|uniref:PIPK domain-containing protein n=1 Tax=Reticulomyxa filosa TaxID=46433 RepID=X6LBU1_RETFI|nr:hypothetical protein RFI_39306 [Reticulomyxa filosa]|eukprot:ETN98209.1 hypothetical protein RFI_39306 [Reticulomyxa filosa]
MKDMDLTRYVVLAKPIREKILDQLESDSLFLRDLGVMDYSLLLGIYYIRMLKHRTKDPINFLNRPNSKQQKKANQGFKEPEHLLNEFNGGVQAQIIEGPGIYYIGMIDILQKWNFSKKIEHFLKCWILRNPADGVSCVEPYFYQHRFMSYLRRIIITDEDFLERNTINTGMFGPQTLLQYPGSEMVADACRVARPSISNIAEDSEKENGRVTTKQIFLGLQSRSNSVSEITAVPLTIEQKISRKENLKNRSGDRNGKFGPAKITDDTCLTFDKFNLSMQFCNFS